MDNFYSKSALVIKFPGNNILKMSFLFGITCIMGILLSSCGQKIVDKSNSGFNERLAMMETSNRDEAIFLGVEQMPEFKGGKDAFNNYIFENFQYPEEALKNNVTGRVVLQFVVEKDGSIGPINVMKGMGYGCDEEAIRLIKCGPRWQPGVQNGLEVRTWFVVPIEFNLAD